MLPLAGTSPTSPEELRHALDRGLQLQGLLPRSLTVTGGLWPAVETLRIDLTGGEITRDRPFPHPAGPASSTVNVTHLEVIGMPLLLVGAPVQFHLRATEVVLHEHQNANTGGFLLVPASAREGSLDLQSKLADLEAMLQRTASEAAKPHGVDITQVSVKLVSNSPRSVAIEAVITVKAFMMKTQINVSGDAEIDGDMMLHLKNLRLTGSGIAVGMAKTFLKPHFDRLEQKPVSLGAFALGEVKLRDIRVEVGETVRVAAQFGAA